MRHAARFRSDFHAHPVGGKKTCAVCDRPLTVHETVAGTTCSESRCKHDLLKRTLQEDARKAEAVRRRLESFKGHASSVLGVPDAESLTLSDVPSNDRPVTPLPEKRRRAFRDALTRSISLAAASVYGKSDRVEWTGEENLVSPAVEPTEGELRVLGGGCATCRGRCCEQGGEHAFLNPAEMRRYMLEHPDERPREVLETFLSRLPSRTYRDSCVFQARAGCALPRSIRSSICNAYYCDGLTRLWTAIAGRPSSRALIGAIAGGEIVRAAVCGPDEHRELPPVNGRAVTRPDEAEPWKRK